MELFISVFKNLVGNDWISERLMSEWILENQFLLLDNWSLEYFSNFPSLS